MYRQRQHFERDILLTFNYLSGGCFTTMDFVYRKISERPVTKHEKITGFGNMASIIFVETGVPFTHERNN